MCFTVLGDFGQCSCPTLAALEARGDSVEASGPQNWRKSIKLNKNQQKTNYMLIFSLVSFLGKKKAPAGALARSTELLRKWRAGGLKINGSASKVVKIIQSLIKSLNIHTNTFFLDVIFGEQKAPAGALARST